jgi:hypothetical protein
MSYEGRIEYKDLVVYFEYGYNAKEDALELETWTAWDDNGNEIQIPDADTSLEIETRIRNFLEYEDRSGIIEEYYNTDDQDYETYKDFLMEEEYD